MAPFLLRSSLVSPAPVWEERCSLNHRIYFIASLCICSLQTVLWQHHESSCQLHPGQPLPLKTWSYESLTSQQSLTHTGQSGAGGGGHSFLLYHWTLSFSQSLQNQHTDLDLWKLLYWRITREDFDSSYKANSDYVYLSVIFLSQYWVLDLDGFV